MQKVFIIEDDAEMAECIALAVRQIKDTEVEIFSNVIAAINAFSADVPQLIFLDILLDGPDGFTLLNELNSYTDTVEIPIIIASSLALPKRDLLAYNVAQVLDKETMTPRQIIDAVQDALNLKQILTESTSPEPEWGNIDACQ